MRARLSEARAISTEELLEEVGEVAVVITAGCCVSESATAALSDEALRARTDEFRKRIADGASLDDVLPDRCAMRRVVPITATASTSFPSGVVRPGAYPRASSLRSLSLMFAVPPRSSAA